jgi:hypothetical protein
MFIVLAIGSRITRGKLNLSWIYWLFAIMFDFWAARRIILAVT